MSEASVKINSFSLRVSLISEVKFCDNFALVTIKVLVSVGIENLEQWNSYTGSYFSPLSSH